MGTSRNINYYTPDCEVIGVDYSPSAIEIALTKNSPTNISYRLEDVENLSFKDNTFDTVVDTFGLEYYLNPRQALKEMRRVCKKDGYILLLNQGAVDNYWLQKYYRFTLPIILMKFGYFPHRPWDKIVDDMGFQVVQRKRFLNGSVYYQILQNNKD